jgi:hypothetical protein
MRSAPKSAPLDDDEDNQSDTLSASESNPPLDTVDQDSAIDPPAVTQKAKSAKPTKLTKPAKPAAKSAPKGGAGVDGETGSAAGTSKRGGNGGAKKRGTGAGKATVQDGAKAVPVSHRPLNQQLTNAYTIDRPKQRAPRWQILVHQSQLLARVWCATRRSRWIKLGRSVSFYYLFISCYPQISTAPAMSSISLLRRY